MRSFPFAILFLTAASISAGPVVSYYTADLKLQNLIQPCLGIPTQIVIQSLATQYY